MRQEQKNNEKQEERGIGIWFLGSMFLSFVTVALVVNRLIKSENWLEEAIVGAVLSIFGVCVGIVLAQCKSSGFLKDVIDILIPFIVLMDIGLCYCWIQQQAFPEVCIDTKIFILSIAISYVIGLGIGEMCAAYMKRTNKEDNQEE